MPRCQIADSSYAFYREVAAENGGADAAGSANSLISVSSCLADHLGTGNSPALCNCSVRLIPVFRRELKKRKSLLSGLEPT